MNRQDQPGPISTQSLAGKSEGQQHHTEPVLQMRWTRRALAASLCAMVALLAALWLPCSQAAFAQSEVARSASAPAAVIPHQMWFTGMAANRAGDTVEAEFRIYATAEGGEPLWSETQRVMVDENGHYSVLLGSATQGGLPQSLFAGGQARWLGVSIERGEEMQRSMLTSVPYAMKAADAETVGGLPAGSFVTQQQLAAMAKAISAQLAPAVLPNIAPSGSGTTDYLAMWTNSTTLGDSVLYQSGSKVGIGTTAPDTALHVFSGDLTVGNLALKFPTPPYGSPSINLVSSNSPSSLLRQTLLDGSGRFNIYWNAYNAAGGNSYYVSGEPATKWNVGGVAGAGGTAVYVAPSGKAGNSVTWNTVFSSDTSGNTSLANQAMTLQAGGSVGIGTTTPAAKLEVNGTAKFDGLITFASGQTFPGTGTITGITTSSPLTGSGTSGSVALGLNETTLTSDITSGLESTFDSRYALLTGGNIFSSYVEAFQTFGSAYAALYGVGSNGSIGTFGDSDSGIGVEGGSTSGTGVYGTSSSGYGTFGSSSSTDGVHGESSTGTGVAGLSTSGYGVYASSSSNYALAGISGSANAVYGQVSANNTGAVIGRQENSSGYWAFYGFGNLGASGTKSSVVPVDNGTRQVALYAVESPGVWFEDYGSGRLVSGVAFVPIDPGYAQTVNTSVEYHVFLTPDGDCEGLYVAARTATGFEVRELHHGTSNVAFDYRIIALRRGYETTRLADVTNAIPRSPEVTLRLADATKAAPKLSGVIRRPAHAGSAAGTTTAK